jgi:hypothetical protein
MREIRVEPSTRPAPRLCGRPMTGCGHMGTRQAPFAAEPFEIEGARLATLDTKSCRGNFIIPLCCPQIYPKMFQSNTWNVRRPSRYPSITSEAIESLRMYGYPINSSTAPGYTQGSGKTPPDLILDERRTRTNTREKPENRTTLKIHVDPRRSNGLDPALIERPR